MTSETDQQPLSVVLVGPPGAGKSTIGRKLARELGVDLYDTDAGIEEQTGRTIPEIFAEDGEPEFRRIEEQVVRAAVLAGHGIISLGGGSVLSAATREILRGRTVVYLEISVGEGLRRTGASTNRPLLNGDDPAAKYRELMKIRRPLYREVASVRVRTDGRSPGRVVRMILGRLGLESTLPQEETTPEAIPAKVDPSDSTRSRSRRRRRRGRGRGDKPASTQPNPTAPEANSPAQTSPNDSDDGATDPTTPRRSRRSRRRSSRAAGPAANTPATTTGTVAAATAQTETSSGTSATSAAGSAVSSSTAADSPQADGRASRRSSTTGSTGSRRGRRRTAATSVASPGTVPEEATSSGGAAGGNATDSAAGQQDSAPGAGRSRRARARRARARQRTREHDQPEQQDRDRIGAVSLTSPPPEGGNS